MDTIGPYSDNFNTRTIIRTPANSEPGLSTAGKLLVAFTVVLGIVWVTSVAKYVIDKYNDHESSTSGSETTTSSGKHTTKWQESIGLTRANPHGVSTLHPNKDDPAMIHFLSAAERMKENMDYYANPCDDFYKFACGGFLKKYENILTEGVTQFNFFLETQIKTFFNVKELLIKPERVTDLACVKKTKLYFQSCMDKKSINKRGIQTLKKFLVDELGGWPLTHTGWEENSFDFMTKLVAVNQLSVMPIIAIFTYHDLKDNTINRQAIIQPSLGLPGRDFFLGKRNEGPLVAYEKFITGIASDLGMQDKTAGAKDIKDMVDFEIKLANISATEAVARESISVYNPMTLEQVQGNYSRIFNWTKYVNLLLSITKDKMDGNEILMNMAPQYLSNLGDVLINTPKRTLANYIIWTLILNLIRNRALGTLFLEKQLQIDKALYGTAGEPDWEAGCVDSTKTVFMMPLGRLFVEEHFDRDSKKIAEDMIAEHKKAFTQLMNESDWLDEKTKQYAEEKKNSMNAKIGYPDYVYNDSFIDSYYNEIKITGQFFENIIDCMRFGYRDNLRALRKPPNKEEWNSAASETNAFYIQSSNTMIFPAGILQDPFFNKRFPKSMNYGAIGAVIGHEIIHGFDDEGRKYDKVGNLHNWWSPEAESSFNTKSQCMIEQYGNFMLEPSKIKGEGFRTLGENIADNGGLRQSYRAYNNWVKSQGKPEPQIPGLNFTHNQIFFISFGQLWCNIETDASLQKHVNEQVHSLGEFRVNGVAQNSKEFSELFHCRPGSKMNPLKKCHIW